MENRIYNTAKKWLREYSYLELANHLDPSYPVEIEFGERFNSQEEIYNYFKNKDLDWEVAKVLEILKKIDIVYNAGQFEQLTIVRLILKNNLRGIIEHPEITAYRFCHMTNKTFVDRLKPRIQNLIESYPAVAEYLASLPPHIQQN